MTRESLVDDRDRVLAERVSDIAETIVDTSTEEGKTLLRVAERLEQEFSVREQHDRVWAAVTKDGGMRLSSREAWRDANFREWEVWVGPMVECPRCAFTFGADHTDDDHGAGYSCPNCDYDGHVFEEPTS